MAAAGGEVKRKVYDNRIVTFAPLYCGTSASTTACIAASARTTPGEKRQYLGVGEDPRRGGALAALAQALDRRLRRAPHHRRAYMAEAIRTIYDVRVKARKGWGAIRRVNVNAAPMKIADLAKLHEAGICTYQVFQETYHKQTYKRVHPSGPKADYRWRLYALHRAMDAGIDDVATGALFGLYDWRFEVMGLLYHAIDLETHFSGIGPHTISFPRLNPAEGSSLAEHPEYRVSDEDFKKLITVIRLSVPYTGMIITARESAQLRREAIPLGCTQTDASTRIGIGAYSEQYTEQEKDRQQFVLGDTRSLDEVIREFAEMGLITSFCTAGYRCGRTGDKIMGLLKTGRRENSAS
jgi:2-iminoacetate synthase